MRVCLDLDGVLCQFDKGLEWELQKSGVGSTPMGPKGPDSWDWFLIGQEDPHKIKAIKKTVREIMDRPYFWFNLAVHSEGSEAYGDIQDLVREHEVFVITQRKMDRAHYEITRGWIDYYYPCLRKTSLILIDNKVPLFDPLRITHVIDDHPELILRKAMGEFKATLLMPKRTYNKGEGTVKSLVKEILHDTELSRI